MSGVRWPWQPLEKMLGGTLHSQAVRVGVDDAQLYRWKRAGLSDPMADRCAIRAGLRPAIVWPDWSQKDECAWEPEPIAETQARMGRLAAGLRRVTCHECAVRTEIDRGRFGFLCDECSVDRPVRFSA